MTNKKLFTDLCLKVMLTKSTNINLQIFGFIAGGAAARKKCSRTLDEAPHSPFKVQCRIAQTTNKAQSAGSAYKI